MTTTFNEEQSFRIRVYSKAELAMLYCPGKCLDNALETLYEWTRLNKTLMDELRAIGYNKYRRSYTPAEVRIIVKYLGEP